MIKILLIEDDTMIASGICYALEMEGYETYHVTTIADTRKLVEDNKFDLAIIDLQQTIQNLIYVILVVLIARQIVI